MRVSGYTLLSRASIGLAGVVYLAGRLVGNRMVAAGQGWEMAFYLSPAVFLAIDFILCFGIVIAAIGVAIGPGWGNRFRSLAVGLLNLGCFVVVPWHGLTMIRAPLGL